jgi:hypothetical protein
MPSEGESVADGRVERVLDGVVEGWAWNPVASDQRLELRVMLDGQEVGATVAELPRPSLAAAGIGDGIHAFRFVLPATLASPGEHLLRVDASGEPLPPAAGFVVESERDQDRWHGADFKVESPERRANRAIAAGGERAVDGRIDLIRNGVVDGWAWDPSTPAERVHLQVLLDDEVVGSAVAELPRPSLAAAGVGDGAYAFRFVLPVTLASPGQHTLRVQAGGAALPASGGFAVQADDGDPWYAARFTVEVDADPGDGSEPPEPALVGLDGWLFDGGAARRWSEDRAVAATELAVASLLERLSNLEERVAEAGVKLLAVLCPAKEHVYRDELPRVVRDELVPRPGDPLIRGMLADPVLDPLDLLAAMQLGAEEHPVFLPTSGELSDWGSYCAYRAIIKRIATIVPGVEPPIELTESSLREGVSRPWKRQAMLATDIGLVGCPPEALPAPPPVPVVVPPPVAALRTPDEHLARIRSDFVAGWEQPDREQLARVLFVGPPTYEQLAEWAGRHFRFTLIVGAGVSLIDLVSLERPDVVVYLVDERSLLGVGT